jgi:hypothetical protein
VAYGARVARRPFLPLALALAVALALPGLAGAEPSVTTEPSAPTIPSVSTIPPSATTAPPATTVPATPSTGETSLAVGDEAAYRAALATLSADASGPHTIDLAADITVDDGTDPTYTGDQELTIRGHGFALDAAGTSRLLVADSPADALIHLVDLTLRNGRATGDGGAVLVLNASSVDIVDSRFDTNEASGSGGAVEVPLTAVVDRSDFTGNVAVSGDGGALDAAAAAGEFVIRASQFVENDAPAGDGGAVSAIGFGSISTGNGVQRSTFVGNTARRGGGLVLSGGSAIADSTILDNRATVSGGGLLAETSSTSAGIYLTLTGNAAPQGANLAFRGRDLFLVFSVIAEPQGGGENCHFAGSSHTNIVHADDHSCGPGTNGGPPLLGPPADNGGRTLTREPLPGSPLIDAVPDGYGSPAVPGGCARFLGLDPTDQRGVLRPQDGDGETRRAFALGAPIEVAADCDIGAVEARAFVRTPLAGPVPGAPPFTG